MNDGQISPAPILDHALSTGAVTADRTFIFWVYSGSVLARIAARVGDGPWGHMGIGFNLSNGMQIYYEALFAQGFVGPISISELHNFIIEKPKRKYAIEYTDLNESQSRQKLKACEEMRGTAGYAELQLLAMAMSERYHIPVPRSPRRVVCSEAVSRILSPEIELRDSRRTRHDMVNPSSAWRRWLEIKSGYAHISALAHAPAAA